MLPTFQLNLLDCTYCEQHMQTCVIRQNWDRRSACGFHTTSENQKGEATFCRRAQPVHAYKNAFLSVCLHHVRREPEVSAAEARGVPDRHHVPRGMHGAKDSYGLWNVLSAGQAILGQFTCSLPSLSWAGVENPRSLIIISRIAHNSRTLQSRLRIGNASSVLTSPTHNNAQCVLLTHHVYVVK